MVSAILPRRLGAGAAAVPSVLRNRTFRRYWLSQVVSMTGTWMQQVAQSLVVLSLTTSAMAVGAVGIAGSVPLLLLTLHGGIVADRYDRRRILIATQATLSVLAIVFATLVAGGNIAYWHIILLSSLLGTTTAFELPASQALVPELVDYDELPQAIALNSAAFNAARLVGPALAGIAIAAVGLAGAFAANAASFLAVIAVLLSMRGRRTPPRDVPASARQAMSQGLDYVRQQPQLTGLIGLAAATSLLVFPHVTVLLPLYVTAVLGAGSGWVGGMLSCIGFGSLLGALTMLKSGRSPRGAQRRIRIATAGLALGLGGLAAARSPYVAAPVAVLLAFCMSLGMAQIATRVQQLAPDELRGRIMSVYALAVTGTTPIAVLLIAGLAEVIGQPWTLLICGIAYAVATGALFALFLRHRRAPAPGATAIAARLAMSATPSSIKAGRTLDSETAAPFGASDR